MLPAQEALEDGKFDTLKGSYYANPMQDNEDMDDHLRQQYPSYCRQVASYRLKVALMFFRLNCWHKSSQRRTTMWVMASALDLNSPLHP